MKCDACSQIFCGDHIMYSTHQCPESYKKDNQVPVCPLCNQPVPLKKDEMPDVVVGQHIDNDCQSDPARKRRKIYTNKCSNKGCKQKELIPVTCEKCHKNFCLKHRNEMDHNCEGFEDSGRGMSKPGSSAIHRNQAAQQSNSNSSAPKSRASSAKPQQTTLSQQNFGRDLNRERRERQSGPGSNQTLQGGLSEDEALARAIQMSMADSQQGPTQTQTPNRQLTQQEQDDLLLAQAIAASQEEATREQRRRHQSSQKKTTCSLS